MSVRRAGAWHGEEIADKVVRFEESDLSERHKAALRLGFEFHTDPSRVSEETRRAVAKYYPPEEIVAMLLNIICYSMNKVRAASGFDRPADPDKLTAFVYDDDGIAHIIDRSQSGDMDATGA